MPYIAPYRSQLRPYNHAYAYRGLTAFATLSMAVSVRLFGFKKDLNTIFTITFIQTGVFFRIRYLVKSNGIHRGSDIHSGVYLCFSWHYLLYRRIEKKSLIARLDVSYALT
ncbi:MAG: hypothetical protein ABW170_19610 [Candidatus Thiodiazotropha sp. L084R]